MGSLYRGQLVQWWWFNHSSCIIFLNFEEDFYSICNSTSALYGVYFSKGWGELCPNRLGEWMMVSSFFKRSNIYIPRYLLWSTDCSNASIIRIGFASDIGFFSNSPKTNTNHLDLRIPLGCDRIPWGCILDACGVRQWRLENIFFENNGGINNVLKT